MARVEPDKRSAVMPGSVVRLLPNPEKAFLFAPQGKRIIAQAADIVRPMMAANG